MEEFLAQRDAVSVEKTDGFLRFVSESREWAFKYIEDVQSAIKIFEEELGPIVKHYKETKKPLYRKPSETLDKVVDAYDILMSLMPEEEIPAKNTDK
jgi:aspartyl/asparaginyl-tRNA synthetase